MERAIEAIQNTIEGQGGSLVVKMKVTVLLSNCQIMADSQLEYHSPRQSRRTKSTTSLNSWRRLDRKTPKFQATKTRKKWWCEEETSRSSSYYLPCRSVTSIPIILYHAIPLTCIVINFSDLNASVYMSMRRTLIRTLSHSMLREFDVMR